MAKSNKVGDIPSNRYHAPEITNTALASDGATGRIGQAGPWDLDLSLRKAWWTPTSAANSATKTDSYRVLQLVDGSTDGSGTVVMASLALTATHASLTPVQLVVDTTKTLTAGNVMLLQQITVGGAQANGTVLAGGQTATDYEVV